MPEAETMRWIELRNVRLKPCDFYGSLPQALSGVFKGGSTDFKLGGGPVTIKASKIAMTAVLIVKFGASMKMGSG